MKNRPRFFIKHTKSSALLLTLLFHAILFIAALSIVAISVSIPGNTEFRILNHSNPQPRSPRPATPFHPELETPSAIHLPSVEIRSPQLKSVDNITIPTTASPGIAAPLVRLDADDGTGIQQQPGTEIEFFNGIKQQGKRVVFLVQAGPPTTMSIDQKQTARTRMTFHIIRKRLIEMVQKLPKQTSFNVAYYWQDHTSPLSSELLAATPENKQQLIEWGAGMNPLQSFKTYGSSFDETFNQRLAELAWPERIDQDLPDFGPKWYYNYQCAPNMTKFYDGTRSGYENWARALCFAMEQKPDTIFILCTDYVIGHDKPEIMTVSFLEEARKIYGRDRSKHPTVNVVVLNQTGKSLQDTKSTRRKFDPIVSAFRGESDIIQNIRNVMTHEELVQLENLH
jgi:hypothetical protein